MITLLDILNDHGVKLENKGLEYWAECPFHQDTNPSFSVSQKGENYVWHCFSCKKGGSAVEFISEIEKVPIAEAKKIYDELRGIQREMPIEKKLLTDIVEYLRVDFWKSPGGKYVKSRGVTEEVADKCKLAYCDDMQSVFNHFSIDRQYAYDIGIPKDISNCIIYPFYDYDGCFKIHVRKIDEKSYRTHEGKYFKHSLWGINRIKVDKDKPFYLCEGYHDKIALEQANIMAVAMSGTTMHKEYWNELYERGITEIIFALDGDHAGREAMVRILENFDDRFTIMFKVLPFGDPDDTMKEGNFHTAPIMTMLEWYISYKHRNLDALSDKIKMYEDISKFYVRMNSVSKWLTKKAFKDKFGDEALDYLYHDVKPDFKLERVVIANCLYSEHIKHETFKKLDESAFALKKHRDLMMFIKTNNATGPMISTKFDEDFSSDVDLTNYLDYIKSLKEISTRISLSKIFDKAKGRLVSEDASQVIGSMMDSFYKISDDTTHIYSSSEIVKEVMRNISDRVNNPSVLGIPLDEERFPILNKALLGLIPNKLILLSGITGHGKTVLVNNFIDDLVFNKNVPVCMVSLEMTPEELIERQLAMRSGIASTKILTGSLEQSEYDEIMLNAKKLLDDNLFIVYGIYDIYEIVSVIKSMVARYQVRVVVIDYVQLIRMRSRVERWQQLMEISGILKNRVCGPDITAIAVSQMSDIDDMNIRKQSGSKGTVNDVDVGLVIKQLRGDDCKGGANFMIKVDKHRYGSDNVLIPAIFDKSTLRIKEQI